MSSKTIEILGKTFASEEEAREYYKNDLRKRLPGLKKIEGFPIGEDEDILALSNPPFYTACPNPYINEFIDKYGTLYDEETDDYFKQSFEGNIQAGKNSTIYNSHPYHTKVPPEAITDLILHFTKEDDIILDGFCGSGMTGIATTKIRRNAILADLSPIATHISYNYNAKVDVLQIRNDFLKIIDELDKEYGNFFETNYNGQKGKIVNIIWSDVYNCNFCKSEFTHWAGEFNKKVFSCPHCNAELKDADYQRVFLKEYDNILRREINIAKQLPVKINLKINKKRFEKILDEYDHDLISRVNSLEIPYRVPIVKLPKGFNTRQPISSHHFNYLHHFFWRRNLILIAAFFEKAKNYNTKSYLFNIITSTINNLSKRYRYRSSGGGGPSGNLYIPSLSRELNFFNSITEKFKALYYHNPKGKSIISTQSCGDLINIQNNSVDYIFTDPPFGSNIMYNELNFMIEAWLKCYTNFSYDTIINSEQSKSKEFYENELIKAFSEYFRILKPNRWINIEFNNSKSLIWNLLRKAINSSGFIISQVSVLDKQQGSFKQVTSPGSVSKDLLISAFKPSSDYLQNIGQTLSIETILIYIQELLSHLKSIPSVERTFQMMYAKYISLCMSRNYSIELDSKAFFTLLINNFIEEDGYWFTSNQINSYLEYKRKMKLEGIDEIKQGALMMFVTDEKSALVWLHNFLNEPKSFSDIHTAFTQLSNIQRDEVPDLKELLEQNFITENGLYRRPQSEPEHSFILEKREKQLLRQFESLLIQSRSEKKKIKSVRKEAVQLGFEHCYKEKRFRDILTLAAKLDKSILGENAELNEFVEAAEIIVSGIK